MLAFLAYRYNEKDAKLAAQVDRSLRDGNFVVITGHLPGDQDPVGSIRHRIRSSSLVVGVLTANSLTGMAHSRWVYDECTFAQSMGVPVILLIEQGLDGTPSSDETPSELFGVPFSRVVVFQRGSDGRIDEHTLRAFRQRVRGASARYASASVEEASLRSELALTRIIGSYHGIGTVLAWIVVAIYAVFFTTELASVVAVGLAGAGVMACTAGALGYYGSELWKVERLGAEGRGLRADLSGWISVYRSLDAVERIVVAMWITTLAGAWTWATVGGLGWVLDHVHPWSVHWQENEVRPWVLVEQLGVVMTVVTLVFVRQWIHVPAEPEYRRATPNPSRYYLIFAIAASCTVLLLNLAFGGRNEGPPPLDVDLSLVRHGWVGLLRAGAAMAWLVAAVGLADLAPNGARLRTSLPVLTLGAVAAVQLGVGAPEAAGWFLAIEGGVSGWALHRLNIALRAGWPARFLHRSYELTAAGEEDARRWRREMLAIVDEVSSGQTGASVEPPPVAKRPGDASAHDSGT